MKKIIQIFLLIFYLLIPFPSVHANSSEEINRQKFQNKIEASSGLILDQYRSIHAPKNKIWYRTPDGSYQQGLRCGTPHPTPKEAGRIKREFDQRLKALRLKSELSTRSGSPLSIPIAFHVVTHADGYADVSDSQIQAQLDVLNAAYAPYGYQFTHLFTDRTANTAWSTHERGSAEEMAMKNALAHDPATTLNFYFCDLADGLLGYATFPWNYTEGSNMHGVVILYSSVPGGSAAPYNEGDTATHEIGHYLGLYHTFQDGCTEPNDEVADTPQEANPGYGCPLRDSCPSDPGNDPVENYMDYSDDSCMFEFTGGQAVRMDSMVAAYKPSLGQEVEDCPKLLLSEGFDDISLLTGRGWFQINNSYPKGSTDWFQGNPDAFTAHSGPSDAYIAANYNNTSGAAGTISNWLITPPLNFSKVSEFSFWTRVPTDSEWPDRLEVRLSTKGDSTNVGSSAFSVGDFDTLLLTINPDLRQGIYPDRWEKFVIDAGNAAGTGRIAFRYFVTNGGPKGTNSNYIGIDSIQVCGQNGHVVVPLIYLLGD